MEKFAKILKEERARNKKKLTQKRMAELLNISLYTYKKYESLGANHREPNQETLTKIAKILKVETDYLLGLKDF